GDEGVEALITLLNEAAHHERDNLLGILEERFARRVTEEGKRLELLIAETEKRLDKRITEEVSRLEQRITAVEARLEQRITTVEARLEQRITAVEARLVRWMFIFWVGQIGVIVALFALLG
ncbi:MAG: hypothetical protein Q9M35_09860, partial [Rhodothermus sp.]|nr:hypothetical protein [Rhodothermus sp.]